MQVRGFGDNIGVLGIGECKGVFRCILGITFVDCFIPIKVSNKQVRVKEKQKFFFVFALHRACLPFSAG